MGPPPVPPNRRSSKSPSVQLPVPTEASRKGKERAVFSAEEDGDVEMDDGSRVRSGPNSTSTPSKPPSISNTLTSPSRTSPPTSIWRPQTSRPPPPDPPPVPPDPADPADPADRNEMKMPPKMRKRWMHHALEKLRVGVMEGEGRVEQGREGERKVMAMEKEKEKSGLVGLGIRIEAENEGTALAAQGDYFIIILLGFFRGRKLM
ncbi:hypothetical protein CPB84DRAFT_1466888 [Gymnopilus junonius]|uniref:Uncharacterized protein n=1 Tax=Gymnopilus junonius TaxID=109634 RepID=A0A9P5TL92_GYMJU|nr:hypothetical protein CPB84DRAFT_1466888 [Gymnopilus junonius]